MSATCFAASTPAAHKNTTVKAAPAKTASSKSAPSKSTTVKSTSSAKTSAKPASQAKSAAAPHGRSTATPAAGKHTRKGGGLKSVAARPRSKGQQAIDRQRTLEIQQALIREHYLQGEPSGVWDQPTRDAFTRIQDENHWQTKIVPDSRALIKLGLGPSRQNLLNPDSAALAAPPPPRQEKPSSGGTN